MTEHKQAKVEAKPCDFDYILTKKEEQERDQREKKVNEKRMMEEEKLVRDKQIEGHARAKYLVKKEKRRDLHRLRVIEQQLKMRTPTTRLQRRRRRI
jgi:hypothetical protein